MATDGAIGVGCAVADADLDRQAGAADTLDRGGDLVGFKAGPGGDRHRSGGRARARQWPGGGA